MEIHCKRCQAPIPSDNINLDRLIAKCGACNAVFAFQLKSKEGAGGQTKGEAPRPEDVSEAGLPGGGLSLSWRYGCRGKGDGGEFVLWFHVVFGAFFAVVSIPLVVGPFLGLLFVANAVKELFGAVTLKLTAGAGREGGSSALVISHSPIPYPSPRTLPGEQIEQLYVRERLWKRRRSSGSHYDLIALTKSNSAHTLVSGLPTPAHGLFLERRIESWLGIEDRPIAEEIRGK